MRGWGALVGLCCLGGCGGEGDITAVGAGAGLTGGAESGDATLAVDFGSGSEQVAAGDVVDDLVSQVSALEDTIATLQATLATMESELDAQADEVAALSDPPCPPGYDHDDSETDIVLCTRGNDEIVAVGDFWVDRYEASVWQNADCTGTRYGSSADDYPAGFADTGYVAAPADAGYACSTPGVVPSRHITWFQAQTACVMAGKHLVTNGEWQAAVVGTPDPGESDGSSGACLTWVDAPQATGNAFACRSTFGVEDMIGNLWEWVDLWESEPGWNGQLHNWTPFAGDAYFHGGPDDITYGELGSTMVALDNPATESARHPAAAMRGGHWHSGFGSGAFTFTVHQSPTSGIAITGFRCARGR